MVVNYGNKYMHKNLRIMGSNACEISLLKKKTNKQKNELPRPLV